MSMRSRVISALVFLVFVAGGTALAQTAQPATQAAAATTTSHATGSTVLVTLLLCGLFGLVGQACRMIVGFTTLAIYKVNSPPDQQDLFNLARLIFSMIVGFIAGFLAGLTQWATSGLDTIMVADFHAMLKFAIAGYIGTDIIEAFTTQFFEPAAKSPQTTTAAAQPQAAATPVKPLYPISATHLQASDLSVVSADSVIKTMQDVVSLQAIVGAGAAPTAAAPIFGFDTEFYPGDAIMGWLRMRAQLRVCVCYLANAPGTSNQSWISKVSYLKSNGWGLLPTYAGLQIHSSGLSAANGARDGAEAANLASQAGFPPSTIIYLDMEDGTPPSGNYLAYIKSWIATVTDKGYTPGIYCSHLIVDKVRSYTPIIWSFHIPNNTEGQSYQPDTLPPGTIDTHCIATQYRQKVNLTGLTIPATVDSEGLDLNISAVADPSNYAAVSHALGL